MFYYEVGIECKNGKARKVILTSEVKLERRNSMDEAIAQALLAKYASEDRVAELKQLLSNSDYISCKIAEGAATREEYAEIITQRQEWRDEINQLESGEQS